MSTGILYAMADDGVNLPVIDVTNAAFAVSMSDAELAARSAQFVLEQAQRQEIPASLRDALARSTLGRALMEASGTFLGGMSTYRIKLGPDNLGADANPIDRSITATFPAFTSRLRLQDMARLLADGLLPTAAENERPICLINIGGGAGSDSWNALIYLHTEHADLLLGREVVIAVLDLDDRGPAFGVRAVDALRAPGAPLGGLDISLRHFHYDWAQTGQLQKVLEELHACDAACAISSEGGLFEYGSDEEILANLEAIHAATAADAFVVGSVTREGAAVRASHGATRIAARPRTMEAFRSLFGHAGWIAQCVLERPFSYHVRLVKA